jgi:hypothetical protein
MKEQTMRPITTTESYATAAAVARMFPEARWSYLRSALHAAVVLTVGGDEYLNRMDNRAYHTRVRDANLTHYLKVARAR